MLTAPAVASLYSNSLLHEFSFLPPYIRNLRIDVAYFIKTISRLLFRKGSKRGWRRLTKPYITLERKSVSLEIISHEFWEVCATFRIVLWSSIVVPRSIFQPIFHHSSRAIAMSLRSRLILSIACVLVLTLGVGCVLIYLEALQKVDTEMEAALGVGVRTVQNATDDADEAVNPLRQLQLLVADFDGNRHVQAFLMDGQGLPIAKSMLLIPTDPSPLWFNHLLAHEPRVVHLDLPLPFARYGSILLSTDSHNEIDEAWNDLQVTLGMLAFFCALVLALVYFTLGRPLAILKKMTTAFRLIGYGDYSPRIEEKGAPELAEFAHRFNDMAGHLAATEQQKAKLQQQLANVQEEERADLARDLHDEIGPLLFALNIDVTTLQRQLGTVAPDTANHIEGIASAVSEIQVHVRSMQGKLRPAILLDLGLDQAVDNLVGFWRLRRPNVRINVDLAHGSFGEKLDATIYRVFQEGLNNSLRHGNPSQVALGATLDDDDHVTVTVTDNGGGLLPKDDHAGYGLIGMRERVESLGGTLTVSNRSDRPGVAIFASFPRADSFIGVAETV